MLRGSFTDVFRGYLQRADSDSVRHEYFSLCRYYQIQTLRLHSMPQLDTWFLRFPEKPTNRFLQPIYSSDKNIWSIFQPIYLPHHKLYVRNFLPINNTVQHIFNGKPMF